jgi:hypothetical protein
VSAVTDVLCKQEREVVGKQSSYWMRVYSMNMKDCGDKGR